MDTKDEIRVRVLEERVHNIDRSVHDVEKCCGSLRGDAQRLGERVVVLEHDVNSNCVAVKHDVDVIKGQSKADSVLVNDLREEITTLRNRLWWAITIALGAVIMDIIGLTH